MDVHQHVIARAPYYCWEVPDLARAPRRTLTAAKADGIWLSSRGWHVTGIDVTVAFDFAAERAADAGEEVSDRIMWRQTDILSGAPTGSRSSSSTRRL